MAGTEERIPRHPLSEYEEIEGGALKGIFQHGWMVWKVALDDTNQYGPHAMILLLAVTATVTGLALLGLGYIL